MKPELKWVVMISVWSLIFISVLAKADNGRAAIMKVRMPNGIIIQKKVKSMKEGRYKNIIRQGFDLSCGAASLATIMTYYYKDPIEEIEIVKYILEKSDRKKIAEKGFSLLDLKSFAVQRNYQVLGYKNVKPDNLRKLKFPTIVLLSSKKYTHFVLLKGVRGSTAFLADPAFGNRTMSIEEFERDWNGVILLVVSNTTKLKELSLDTTILAPESDILIIQAIGASGFQSFGSFQTAGEF